ncbi:hypothetical protein [Nocardia sp. NPDC049707]|uniref:hypothetical protein n=1 Tax=Nocardia sp. NPDC049707 TaxID=3154735 RepID=UPI00342DD929
MVAPTAPKKTVAPKSRWATLRDEARKEHKPRPPYMFDGTEPPTEITAPDSVERVTAMAMLIDSDGSFEAANLRKLLEATCGAAFPIVWGIVKDEPFEVLFSLLSDINDHFNAVPGEEGADLPGGA